MITKNIWGLLALAADSGDNATTGAAAPEPTTDGSTPSPEVSTDASAPGDEPDYEALLNANGSKVDEFGAAINVDLDAEIPTGDKPAADPAKVETPAATKEETEEEEDNEDDQPAAGTNADGTPKKGPANSFRLNLKDAAHADDKRRLIRVLRDEPGLDPAEAYRRAGIPLPAGTAPAATTETKTDPAPAEDARKGLRDEIAQLQKDSDTAADTEFDFAKARKIDKQVAEKQRELDRLDDQAAQREQSERASTARTQAQQYDTSVSDSWKGVAALYPDVGNPASEFHKTLQSEIGAKHAADPGFFKNPDWPALLTVPLAIKAKLAPKAPAATAPDPAPKATLAPKKALTPVPPAPAPGGAASGGDSAAWNPERESIEAFLDRTGTKLNQQPAGV